MNLSTTLATTIQRERQGAIEQAPSVRAAACYRACCAPTLLDRVATRLGRNDCLNGAS